MISYNGQLKLTNVQITLFEMIKLAYFISVESKIMVYNSIHFIEKFLLCHPSEYQICI